MQEKNCCTAVLYCTVCTVDVTVVFTHFGVLRSKNMRKRKSGLARPAPAATGRLKSVNLLLRYLALSWLTGVTAPKKNKKVNRGVCGLSDKWGNCFVS